jgi:cytoskeleton protein RodZ
MMRHAREAKGLHLTMLATTLRVPPERLKALESERWTDLPDLVFARALAMSVCRQLKIDPAPVLGAMPDADPRRSVRVTAAISEPLGGMASPSSNLQRTWLMVGLGALVLVLWVAWGLLLDQDSRPNTSVEVPEMPPPNSGLPAAVTEPVALEPAPAAAPAAAPASAPPPAPATVGGPVSGPAAPGAPPQVITPVPTPAKAPVPPASATPSGTQP